LAGIILLRRGKSIAVRRARAIAWIGDVMARIDARAYGEHYYSQLGSTPRLGSTLGRRRS